MKGDATTKDDNAEGGATTNGTGGRAKGFVESMHEIGAREACLRDVIAGRKTTNAGGKGVRKKCTVREYLATLLTCIVSRVAFMHSRVAFMHSLPYCIRARFAWRLASQKPKPTTARTQCDARFEQLKKATLQILMSTLGQQLCHQQNPHLMLY